MATHEARFRVRYAETDQMGVAYHANYLVWMEVGRVEFCRAAGIRYKDMEESDKLRLAVVEANCRYILPARYDDEIVVETSIDHANRRMVRFQYTIRNALSGETLATGLTKHIVVGPDFRPVRLPEKYYPMFGIENGGPGD